MKNHKKIFPLLLISFIALASIIAALPTAQAAAVTTAVFVSSSVTTDNLGATWAAQSAAKTCAGAETFLSTYTGYVTHSMWGAKIIGATSTIDVYITSEIWTTTSQAYNSKPDTLLATSTNAFHSSQLTNTSITFLNFNFDQTLQLTAGVYYAVIFKVANGTLADSNYIGINNYASGGYGGYSSQYLQGPAWTTAYAADYIFSVTVDTEVAPTPTPPVTPTPTPTDDYKWDENEDQWYWWNGTHWIPSSGPSPTANAQITTFTGNMITYIVPLLLLLLPAVVGAWALGKAGAAKWGFIAGLNIGAIMCYLYLPTFGLWAVIAIVVVDVLMLFASQRGE